MLYFYHSNRMEVLLDALMRVTESQPEDPFVPETIVVQNLGIAQWLAQQIARRQGILANINFPLPAQFIWQLFRSQFSFVPDTSVFNPDALLWRCMALLPTIRSRPEFLPIDNYLAGEDAELKLYQLSQRIAELYDQYLLYRPDWIRQWERGEGDHWQAHLWRELRRSTKESHWVDLVDRLKKQMQQDDFRKDTLPERVSLFALSSLSPGYLDLLAQLAQQTDVHLFLLNPSANYWGDILSEADLARLRAVWRRTGRSDVSDSYTIGNSLLASMGKQARDFLDQLHVYPAIEEDDFVEAQGSGILQRVQDDILNLQISEAQEFVRLISSQDDSLRVHVCHSPMREAQVLHDELLKLFNGPMQLLPHEVLVMMPDVEGYASYIDAVFASADGDRAIPYRIAGRADTFEHPLIEILLAWLQLPLERFEAPTVLSWLDQPAMQRQFKLDEEALERIRLWVRESGIRWGLDGAHRAELGLPDWGANSWEFGFDRLFAGFALPVNQKMYCGIAPLDDIEGGEAVWFGQLHRFIDLFAVWRKRLAQPATVLEWQQRLQGLMNDFFHPDEAEEQVLNSVCRLVDDWVQQTGIAAFVDKISANIVRQHLSSGLNRAVGKSTFFSGAVTFCSIASMGAIPFRVVCLLGMNDGDFPRRQQPLGFDLIAREPRKGDRSRREDDRYAFLQCILSARERLYISYVGRSPQDNSKKEPSVLVSELLDYIEQGHGGASHPLRQEICIEHPLQPFSLRNFVVEIEGKSTGLGSYAKEWLDRTSPAEIFSDQPIEPMSTTCEKIEVLELATLCQFIENPARQFLQQRLGIQAKEYEESLPGTEVFQLDNLEKYQLKTELLQALLVDDSIDESFALLAARGELPGGAFGAIEYEESQEPMQQLAELVQPYFSRVTTTLDVDLSVAGIRLAGWLKPLKGGGLFRYSVNVFKPKYQLKLWVEHLALCAMGEGGESLYVEWNKKAVCKGLKPVEQQQALDCLTFMVEQYRSNLRCPIAFFPNSSMEYATTLHKGKSEQEALFAAQKIWVGSDFAAARHGADSCDEWFKLAFRGREPLDAQFSALAKSIVAPLLAHLEDKE